MRKDAPPLASAVVAHSVRTRGLEL